MQLDLTQLVLPRVFNATCLRPTILVKVSSTAQTTPPTLGTPSGQLPSPLLPTGFNLRDDVHRTAP